MRKMKKFGMMAIYVFCKIREIIRSFLYGNDLIICWEYNATYYLLNMII